MFFKTTLVCILIVLIFALTNAQVVSDGLCPEVKVVADFKLEPYMGTWYEYGRYPVVFEIDGKCNTAHYTLQKDGVVVVKNSMTDEKSGEEWGITGFATQQENAKLLIAFPVNVLLNATGNYWVLDTDYTNYSVVYYCKQIPTLIRATTAWILTRDRIPTAEIVQKAESVFMKNKISLQELQITNQNNCT